MAIVKSRPEPNVNDIYSALFFYGGPASTVMIAEYIASKHNFDLQFMMPLTKQLLATGMNFGLLKKDNELYLFEPYLNLV